MKNGENCSREVRKIFILADLLLTYVYMYMRYGVIKVLNIFFFRKSVDYGNKVFEKTSLFL